MSPAKRGWLTAVLGAVQWLGSCSAAIAQDPHPTNEPAPRVWKPGDPVEFGRAGNEHGKQVFSTVCAVCHEHASGHVPAAFILKLMTPLSIYRTLTRGAMRVQAQALSDDDKRAVAEYLGGKPLASDAALEPPACSGEAARFDVRQPPVFTGWGLDAANSRFIDAGTAGIDRHHLSRLKLKWALGFDGAVKVRSQPALAGGAIYVGGEDGRLFALDRRSGCLRWQFTAAAEIRSAVVVSPWRSGDAAARPLVYFVDLVGNAYAVEAISGKLRWEVHVDEHPSTSLSAAPVLHNGVLFVPVSSLEEGSAGGNYPCCTFRGSIVAYDAGTGRQLWRTYLVPPPKLRQPEASRTPSFGPSGVAIWDTPSLDVERGVLYFGTGDNYSSPTTALSDAVVAVDAKHGTIKWSYQALAKDAWNGGCAASEKAACPEENGPDYDFGTATIVARVSDGRRLVLAGQKSGWVYAFEASTGKLAWKTKVGRGGIMAGVSFGMAVHGDTLFVPVHDAPDGRDYAEPAKPGLYALDLKTGAYLWKAPTAEGVCENRGLGCVPGIGGSITAVDDLVFAGAGDGRLRIYDGASGEVLWQYDTALPVQTVGGGTATGGAISGGAGPLVFDGNLIVESGYGFAGRTPGNVMLVFAVD